MKDLIFATLYERVVFTFYILECFHTPCYGRICICIEQLKLTAMSKCHLVNMTTGKSIYLRPAAFLSRLRPIHFSPFIYGRMARQGFCDRSDSFTDSFYTYISIYSLLGSMSWFCKFQTMVSLMFFFIYICQLPVYQCSRIVG